MRRRLTNQPPENCSRSTGHSLRSYGKRSAQFPRSQGLMGGSGGCRSRTGTLSPAPISFSGCAQYRLGTPSKHNPSVKTLLIAEGTRCDVYHDGMVTTRGRLIHTATSCLASRFESELGHRVTSGHHRMERQSTLRVDKYGSAITDMVRTGNLVNNLEHFIRGANSSNTSCERFNVRDLKDVKPIVVHRGDDSLAVLSNG